MSADPSPFPEDPDPLRATLIDTIVLLEALIEFRGDWRAGSGDQRLNQGAEQRLSASAGIVNELEEPEIERQVFLRDAAVRPQPGSQERPEAFHGGDVDLAEPVAVLVPGVFAATMADGLVAVAETRKPG